MPQRYKRYFSIWKCLECEMEAHYKGLCRSCSEYDDSGKVLKPVQRTRLNADGSVWEAPENRIRPAAVTADTLRAHRKAQKKLTKNQRAQAEAQQKAMADAMKLEMEAKAALAAQEDGSVVIGESEEE
mgnify:CR=1 FL=1